MVKLGQFNREKKKVSFTEWIKKEGKKEGKYRIKILFPPTKFPSYTLIFDDNEGTEVRLSVKSDRFREALKSLGITIAKKNLPSLLLIVDENGYGLDVDDNIWYILEWRGTYWIYKKDDDEEAVIL